MSSYSTLHRLLRYKGWPFAPRTGIDRTPLNDDQVMAAVKAGSVAAVKVLYERYCDRMRLALGQLRRDIAHV